MRQRYPAKGFTLIEIMVSAGLMALVFASVFSVLALVERIFDREAQEMLAEFDVYNYSMRLERIIGAADQVRELRGHAGFWAITIDHDRQQARETIHLVTEDTLYMIDKDFSWSETPLIHHGEILFPESEVRDRLVRSERLRGVEEFSTRMVYPDEAGSGLFHSFELQVVKSNTNRPIFIKRYAAGGRQDLDTREPFIFQESLPEILQEESAS